MTNSPSPALTIQYPPNKAKFRELARMLSREDSPPDWLCRFFEDWAPCLIVDRGVHLIQPTRKEMRRRLAQVSTAADVLIGALNDTATTEFLDATGTEFCQVRRLGRHAVGREEKGCRRSKISFSRYASRPDPIGSRKSAIARQFFTEGILCGYRWRSVELCSRELSRAVKQGSRSPSTCLLGGVRRTHNWRVGKRSVKGLASLLH